uniref:G-protein coupled receptors family 1 profile domain-containing protein n=1 Tax=Sus scrofa TaxID=9823 RepID=A0A8D1HD16_PIG
METKNYSSSMSDFILLGLSSNPHLQKPLFAVFLIMYLVTLVGNVLIILAIHSDMLVTLLSETKSISYVGCLVQIYLLASTAIDRLVAICNPLHYDVAMSPQHCLLLLLGSCTISHLHSMLYVILMSRLSFCASHIIKHFFCDTQPVLKLSCSETSSSQMVVMTETLAVIATPFLCILFSYLRIIITLLRVPSVAGKFKVFSTCGSHLTVVALFYGTIISVYIRPSSTYSVTKDRVVTVIYTVVTPMLNPFIYSLRNKDMKQFLSFSFAVSGSCVSLP